MTMAAAIESRTAEAAAPPKASRLRRIEIIRDLDQAEPIWRRLEGCSRTRTPYQRFDFLATWQRQIGSRENASPFIVVGKDTEQRTLLLLPLVLRQSWGVRVAAFMGGKHANFNMALWDDQFAAEANEADLDLLLTTIRELSAADVLALTQQPKRWRGLPNPFARLPHQPSVNGCPVLMLSPGAPPKAWSSKSFRRRLNSKERKLQTLPGYRYHLATTDADIARLLDWFFRTKPLRMRAQGLPNVFDNPNVEAFVREVCRIELSGGDRLMHVHALECDAEVIALFAGMSDGLRFSMMFSTYTMSAHSHYSPGLILIRNIVDYYAERGCNAFDLGVGSDDYKRLFCKADDPMIDSFIPLRPRGRLIAAAMSAMYAGQRRIKENRTLLRAAQQLRRSIG